jgi:hypothetical protein
MAFHVNGGGQEIIACEISAETPRGFADPCRRQGGGSGPRHAHRCGHSVIYCRDRVIDSAMLSSIRSSTFLELRHGILGTEGRRLIRAFPQVQCAALWCDVDSRTKLLAPINWFKGSQVEPWRLMAKESNAVSRTCDQNAATHVVNLRCRESEGAGTDGFDRREG